MLISEMAEEVLLILNGAAMSARQISEQHSRLCHMSKKEQMKGVRILLRYLNNKQLAFWYVTDDGHRVWSAA